MIINQLWMILNIVILHTLIEIFKYMTKFMINIPIIKNKND